MAMRRVCAWCETVMEEGSDGADITHGICDRCMDEFVFSKSEGLEEYLDSLNVPILLVDSNIRVLDANRAALAGMKKKASDIEGLLGGQVTECAFADLPGGCGQTVHCAACTIRKTVNAVCGDGIPLIDVEGYHCATDAGGKQRLHRIFVTAQKLGKAVLLKIETAGPA